MNRLNLDNNATTTLDPRVLAAMMPYLADHSGNPSSIHASGRSAGAALHAARRMVAGAMGAADQDEVVFTSGGTEAINLAVLGIARARADRGRHVITSAIEHEAGLQAAHLLEAEGFRVTTVGVDERGVIDVAALEHGITPETTLISIMTANNETGAVQPLATVSAIARRHDALVHTDAVQAFARIPFNVQTPHVDAASVSAHKIHGPKGVGALFLRSGTPWRPAFGGGGQEGGRRPGTENVPAIVGFARAVELAMADRDETADRMKRLVSAFIDHLTGSLDNVTNNSRAAVQLPNTVNLSFLGADSESVLIGLDLAGIEVSAGSACASGSLEPSHVLRAMRLPDAQLRSSVRFSICRDTTAADLERAADSVRQCVMRIRAVRKR